MDNELIGIITRSDLLRCLITENSASRSGGMKNWVRIYPDPYDDPPHLHNLTFPFSSHVISLTKPPLACR
jgi:hypothetical protein